jgi:hypothetical protein
VPSIELQDALIRLDMALTGVGIARAARTSRDNGKAATDPWEIMSNGYYLSDGGYSRLCLSDMTGRISLASVSIKPTRDRWESCAAEIAEVESAVSKLIK